MKLPSQQNWVNRLNGIKAVQIYEFPVYSDARALGEYTDPQSPYHFLNAVPVGQDTTIKTSMVLRVFNHLVPYGIEELKKRTIILYQRIGDTEEITALASLLLGARLRAGGRSREIDLDENPIGIPRDHNYIPAPTFSIDNRRIKLPSARKDFNLDALKSLNSIPSIDPKRYENLIKAAKQYQEALWLSEASPNLTWLFLVSALEIAANDSIQVDKDYEAQFRELKSEVTARLEETKDPTLVKDVAYFFKDTVSLVKKLARFVEKFCPEEPSERPPEGLWKLEWTPENLVKICKVVYDYRSKSLHAGELFPSPMLQPAECVPESDKLREIAVVGTNSMSKGGKTWRSKDCPITLHAFHYLTRGLLLNWWESMIPME